MRIRHQITHQMMYGFAFIWAQCGPLEEKTEMTVARVGTNLKYMIISVQGFTLSLTTIVVKVVS